MSMDIISVYKSNVKFLEKRYLYVFADEKNYFFSKNLSNNLLFINDTLTEQTQAGINQSFEQYIDNLANIYKNVDEKAKLSLIFVNCNQIQIENSFNGVISSDIEIVNNEKPYIASLKVNDYEVLAKLIDKIGNNAKNTPLILIDGIENIELHKELLLTLLTISKSRHIIFSININNKQKFIENYSEEEFKMLQNHFKIVFQNNKLTGKLKDYYSNFLNPKPQSEEEILEEISNNGYVELKKSNKIDYFKSILVLGENLPEDMKEWLKKYNGGKINSIEIFSTKKIKDIPTIQKVNSKKFIIENSLSPDLRYFARDGFDNYYGIIHKNIKNEEIVAYNVKSKEIISSYTMKNFLYLCESLTN